eukprot:2285438-Rhodomonas_salina.1
MRVLGVGQGYGAGTGYIRVLGVGQGYGATGHPKRRLRRSDTRVCASKKPEKNKEEEKEEEEAQTTITTNINNGGKKQGCQLHKRNRTLAKSAAEKRRNEHTLKCCHRERGKSETGAGTPERETEKH